MRLTYEDFKTEILNNSEAYLQEELKDAKVSIEQVNKLNRSYDSLMVRVPGVDASASFDLGAFYENHKDEPLEEMFRSLKAVFGELDPEKGKQLQGAGKWLVDYENVKGSLFVRCSNSVINSEVLQDCPYTALGDLAFTAHVGLNWAEGSVPAYTTLVTDRLMDVWGVGREELFRDAIDNSAKRLPATCLPLSEVMMGLMGEEMPEHAEPDTGLYVLTNNHSVDGAAAVIYPGVLDEMREKIGDFYMIPSSVHEFLLLSDKEAVSIEALEAMVRSVNSNVLKEEEFLSDQLYHYDGREKVMEPAHDFVKRRALEESRALRPEVSEKEQKAYRISPPEHPGKGLTV